MKKYIVIIVILLLLIGLMAMCRSVRGNEISPTPEPAPTATVTAPPTATPVETMAPEEGEWEPELTPEEEEAEIQARFDEEIPFSGQYALADVFTDGYLAGGILNAVMNIYADGTGTMDLGYLSKTDTVYDLIWDDRNITVVGPGTSHRVFPYTFQDEVAVVDVPNTDITLFFAKVGSYYCENGISLFLDDFMLDAASMQTIGVSDFQQAADSDGSRQTPVPATAYEDDVFTLEFKGIARAGEDYSVRMELTNHLDVKVNIGCVQAYINDDVINWAWFKILDPYETTELTYTIPSDRIDTEAITDITDIYSIAFDTYVEEHNDDEEPAVYDDVMVTIYPFGE